MATLNESLNQLQAVEGALCAAIVDSGSGMLLGSIGTGVDMELAAAGNTEVVRAKNKTMQALGLQDTIDDILITLGKQYHIIRPWPPRKASSSTWCSTRRAPTWPWPVARCRTSRS